MLINHLPLAVLMTDDLKKVSSLMISEAVLRWAMEAWAVVVQTRSALVAPLDRSDV